MGRRVMISCWLDWMLERGEYHLRGTTKMIRTNVLRSPLWLALTGLLTACSTPTLKPICPQITQWTAEFQHQAAAEIRANPALVALPEIARQDVVLRDQVGACRKKVAQ